MTTAPVVPHRVVIVGAGFGGLALSALLAEEARAAGAVDPLAVKPPHYPAKVSEQVGPHSSLPAKMRGVRQ